MKTVGEILKIAREGKGLTFEEIERKIRIRAKFLKALEENDYQKFPSSVYARGFIRNYSIFLGLSPEKVLAVFRRQFDERKDLGILPIGLSEPFKNKHFHFRANQWVAIFFLLPLFLFLAYLYREYRLFIQPPKLVILSPQEEMITQNEALQVMGETDPGATLTLNGQAVLLNRDGTFTQEFTLSPGLNTLEFVAKNRIGKEKKERRMVQVELPGRK